MGLRMIGRLIIIPGEEIIFKSDFPAQQNEPLRNIFFDAGVLRIPGTVCNIGDGELILRTPEAAAKAENREQFMKDPNGLKGKQLRFTFESKEASVYYIDDVIDGSLHVLNLATKIHTILYLSHFFIGDPKVELLN